MRFRARIVERDVHHERNRAVERRTVRYVERFCNVQAIFERELGDLRVGQERKLARDLVRKERSQNAVGDAIGDLVRAEDDLVRVGIPQPADAAFGGGLRVGFEVSEQEPVGRFRLAEHVRAKFITLSVITGTHVH